MRVLVVGGGGREHALAWAIARSPKVERILAAPGNPGIVALGETHDVAADDLEGLLTLVERERVDLTVVGPEAPLVAGLVDALEARGHRAFGPTREAARLEGSKAWSRELCERHGIPGPRTGVFEDLDSAAAHLESLEAPYVIKADGLAAGKGVAVVETREEALAALRERLVDGAFGEAGARVLVEEHLTGQEVSAIALTDGETVLPLMLAQDFKRALDGDAGPNTGGMGAYSPVPFVDDRLHDEIVALLEETLAALTAEGVTYRGVLYAGLMLTDAGPKVLEYNARFGDPETQAILPRVASDLLEALAACTEGTLAGYRLEAYRDACVTVVLASGGYPGAYETGKPIEGLDAVADLDGVVAFHAGTALETGRVVTAGGRVLAISALGADLVAARRRAYEACELVTFPGRHLRTDIAKEADDG